ncbi:hypothetical protein [Geobacter sp.]|uniref:hypothetical protein n=1 Tax=Geobacter sp. TaxID=46610 RepID=UPI002609D665|nr:hypothetical protein [Geobacter sp.]
MAEIQVAGPLFDGSAQGDVQRRIERFITSATLLVAREVQKHTPQGVYGYQGGLIASVGTEISGKGTMLVKGEVFHSKPYGDVVDKGRSPGKGMPPAGTLERWIEVKFGVDAKTAKRLEYVVRRKISRKGFEGAHMFDKGLDDAWPVLVTMARTAGLEIARDLNG